MENKAQNTEDNQSVKVLGIAPYEGMKTIMRKLADERNDIDLDVYVGDLNKGLAIARKNLHTNYDVIISRGGTAELIEKSTHLPVIEVTLSVYDILRAIKLAQNYADRYTIVGFPGITASAHLLCDLLQYKIDIFTIHDADEVVDTLKKLKKSGYRMVLCDMITNTTAKRLGLNAILITSGPESISSAFDQAVRLCRSYSAIKAENLFFKDIIQGSSLQTTVLDETGRLFFSTQDIDNTFLEMLQKKEDAILSERTSKFFENTGNILYSFTGKRLIFHGRPYAAFFYSQNSLPFATSKYGIQYSSQQEAEDLFFNSFYSITSSASNIQTVLDNLTQISTPVMLAGETGSGKEQVARIFYSQSQLSRNPLITINCAYLTDRSWNFLTNHYNSPFNDNNNTIYLKDITVLSQNRQQQLLSIMIDMNLCKRNRVIFSCTCSYGQRISAEAMEFVNRLSCVTIYLPPLRERVSEIPALSSLYLNMINVSMANQIIGFEPEAMALMQKYDWPYNYTQFKRILNELALVTVTPYIQTEHVIALLDKERNTAETNAADALSAAATSGECLLNIDRPLDEITSDIIRHVLNQTGGNQSAAARKLGISRTTLWRYMNK